MAGLQRDPPAASTSHHSGQQLLRGTNCKLATLFEELSLQRAKYQLLVEQCRVLLNPWWVPGGIVVYCNCNGVSREVFLTDRHTAQSGGKSDRVLQQVKGEYRFATPAKQLKSHVV